MSWFSRTPAAVEEPTLSEAEVMHVDVYLTSQPPEPPAGYDLGEYKKLTSADYDGYRSCLSPTGKAANIFRADIGQWRYLLVQKHPHECCPDCGLDRHEIEELTARLAKLETAPSVSLMVEHGEFVLRNGESCFYIGKNYRELEAHIEQLGRSIVALQRSQHLTTQTHGGFAAELSYIEQRIATAEAGAVELVKRLEKRIEEVGQREHNRAYTLYDALVRRIETVEFDTSERNTFLWKNGITTSTKALDKSREIHARLEAIENGTAPGILSRVADVALEAVSSREAIANLAADLAALRKELSQGSDELAETLGRFSAYITDLAALQGKQPGMSERVPAQPSRPVLVELRKTAKK